MVFIDISGSEYTKMSGLQHTMLTDMIWSLQYWLQHGSAEGGFLSVSAAHPPKDLKAVYKHEWKPYTELPFLGMRWWQIHLPQALKPVSMWHCPASRQLTWLQILHLNHTTTTTTKILLLYKMAEKNPSKLLFPLYTIKPKKCVQLVLWL